MPGICCAFGIDDPGAAARLQREFQALNPTAHAVEAEGWQAAMHSFSGHGPVKRGNVVELIDGEASAYEKHDVMDVCASRITIDGNLVTAHADSAGVFPIYYASYRGGLLLSSMLHLLARAMRARMDSIAAVQFLRAGHILGARTLFEGVHRLRPGECLRYSRAGGLSLSDASAGWRALSVASVTRPEDVWQEMMRAVETSLGRPNAALMVSGGWDSRTLLGAALRASVQPRCYVHGDLQSRELSIVRRITADHRLELQQEEIGEEVLNPDSLLAGFRHCESAVFPHWLKAGRVLRDQGTRVVGAGVLGEVLGGHYGPAMLGGGITRATRVLGGLAGAKRRLADPVESAFAALRPPARYGSHWYLRRDVDALYRGHAFAEGVAARDELDRIRRRGVNDPAALVEAFITQTRGAQYISAQLRSCRASLEISVPFGTERMLSMSSLIPMEMKIHNRLNRYMLQLGAPSLLEYPFAATLVRASRPIIVQEVTRLARRLLNEARNHASVASGGRISAPRAGWVNFDFLRRGRGLHLLIDSLASDMWDRGAMHDAAQRLQSGDRTVAAHPMYDQMCKVKTLDLFVQTTSQNS